MTACIRLTLLVFPLAMIDAQTVSSEPGGVLRQLTVARFVGSGAESIQAMTSDAAGNVYVAGTTSSPDLPMKNAAQPSIGEALLMRSTDRGLTWQKVPKAPIFPLTVAPHPNDLRTIFVGSADGIYKTIDGGQTWRRVYEWGSTFYKSSGECCFNLVIDPANTRKMYVFAFGTFVHFLASSDSGESWQPRDGPLPRDGTFFPSAKELWVDPNGSGTVGLGVWLSRDQGNTWTRMTQPPMGTPSFTVPDPRHAGWIYAATSAGTGGHLYLSKDWGTTWVERPSPMRAGDSFQQTISYLLFDPDLPNTLYANAFLSGLVISDDAGASWHAPGSPVYAYLAALVNRQCMGGALLVASQGGVLSSLDFGATWQPAQLSRVLDLAAGPGCAVYVARFIASDAFVAKLAPGGSEVLWSTFLGGSDRDTSAAITLDDQGNVYVAGNTASPDFPTTAPRIASQGRQNVFVAKLNPAGRLIYSVVFGGESFDAVTGLAVNSQREVFLTGWTNSKSFPATTGAFQTQAGAYGDGFATKLNSDGPTFYASYLPNFAPDIPSSRIYSELPKSGIKRLSIDRRVFGHAVSHDARWIEPVRSLQPAGPDLRNGNRQPREHIYIRTNDWRGIGIVLSGLQPTLLGGRRYLRDQASAG